MKELSLSQGKVALVDDCDYEWLNQWKWSAAQRECRWYALRRVQKGDKQSLVLMHRQIMGAQPGQQVDHKDVDGLHNWRANLRFCTQTQNNANQKKRGGCSSQYKGVTWDKSRIKWAAQTSVCGKHVHLGRFDSETDAALAYNKAAIEYFGEFARLNVIEGEP